MAGPGNPSRGARERLLDAVPLAAVVLASGAVFRGSLSYFFSQDDFAGLARARGLLAPLQGPWRFVSGQLFYWLMRPLGLEAWAFHAVSVLAHACCAGILYALLRRRFGAPAALLGALFLGAHPTIYTAVYWISAGNEILSLLFALGAIALATRQDRFAWMAAPLFALSLLSKESTILLPLALAIRPGWLDAAPRGTAPGAVPDSRRSRLLVALGAISVVYLGFWFAGNAFGARSGLESGSPYAVSLGRHVPENASSYLGWTAGQWLPITRKFEDIAEPAMRPWAAAMLAIWGLGFGVRRLRRSGWLAGGLMWALLIAPVLGLRNHTYHYYLYAPLIGAAWCLSSIADVAFRPSPRPAARGDRRRSPPPAPRERAHAWPAAIALGALIVANGALLVRKIETMPFPDLGLRADAVVDRAGIARRVYDGLRVAGLPHGARLVFWSPASMRYERSRHPDADVIRDETYWERNVRAALLDGLGVRVMFPEVDSVVFIHAFRPAPPGDRFVLYEPDGRVTVRTPAHVDSLLRGLATE